MDGYFAGTGAGAGWTPGAAALGVIVNGSPSLWWLMMKAATSTWKLWGNEVSLLRMGLNGVDAIATLVALSAMSSVGAAIASTLPLVGGSVPLANAIVAASTAGASTSVAQAAAMAIPGAGSGEALDPKRAPDPPCVPVAPFLGAVGYSGDRGRPVPGAPVS